MKVIRILVLSVSLSSLALVACGCGDDAMSAPSGDGGSGASDGGTGDGGTGGDGDGGTGDGDAGTRGGDGGGDGGSGSGDVCAIAPGCFHETRVMNGAQPTCNGMYDGPFRVPEGGGFLTGYETDPSCLVQNEAEPPACETVVVCAVGMGQNARGIRFTVEDPDHASVDYQELQDGEVICHATSEYVRMDESHCP